ncbi:adenylate/guanylate cyclase domain-containing protein [Reyranella sp.]|uniref:adenylate/guanylate cyclase domain-containing protein n=1 Tax=Reyranella sp. TaxID=1929291 RepID=UPI002F936B3B
MEREQRRLAAIVAADVVGYSRLMGRDESGTLARLKEHRRERLEPALARNSGRLVKLTGDGALVEFGSAVDALRASIEFQQAVADTNEPLAETERIVFRLGIHLGDLIVDGDDLYGDGVNIAARLEGEAPAGGLVISGAVHDAVAGRVRATFDDLGRLALKNIDRPVQAFAVKWEHADWQAATASASTPPVQPVTPLPLPDKPSIAVLPFENMSGDPEQEYFADGMVEDIITALSRFKALFVIARNSSFSYKGKAVDVRQVGRELGVHHVLEGSVRKAGNRVRVTAQLIEAQTGNHLWAQRFDRLLDDIFAVQEEITSSIVSAVGAEVENVQIATVGRARPNNLEAHGLALRAWAEIRDLGRSPDNARIDAVMRMAEEALAIDAQCVPALVALGWAHFHQGFFRTAADPVRALATASAVATRAQGIDHLNHRPYVLKAWVHLATSRHDDALFEARRAHELNANDPDTLVAMGAIESRSGQTKSGIEWLTQALRLNPLNPFQHWVHLNLSVACFLASDYAKGIEWALLCRRSAPQFVQNLNMLAVNYVGLGQLEEARQIFAVANGLAPELLKQRLATGSPLYRLPEDRQRDARFLRIAAGLEAPP